MICAKCGGTRGCRPWRKRWQPKKDTSELTKFKRRLRSELKKFRKTNNKVLNGDYDYEHTPDAAGYDRALDDFEDLLKGKK